MHGCSRAVMLLVVFWATLCASASASRPQHWLETGLSGRALLQEALSNSNGCLGTIPRCEQNACVTRNIQGGGAWACLRCLGTYDPVTDSSGQDNIIQCVCPKGTFENGTSCARCPTDSYCPGGAKVENPTTRGELVTCGVGLVTRNTGARTISDCLAPAGAAMTAPGVATNCSASEYAPKFNRLTKCLKCQGGLEEDPALNLTSAQRATKRVVCKVPPGRYMSQGLVRVCPQGFYRTTYEDFDAAAAQVCTACNPGITTPGAGAKAAIECSIVTQGHGIDNVTSATAAAGLPALSVNASGLPTATLCDFGYYSSGGLCAQCRSGTVTMNRGSKAIEECVIPPGYFLSAGVMTLCPSQFYREGWLLYNNPTATSCTPCGEGIRSEPRDLDENPLAAADSRVRATSTSCYIEAGQGMVAQGKNAYVGRDCPVNTYGVANTTWGLQPMPCKPCPRNMITDAAGSTTMDACTNPAGFGYQSEGASRCAVGFYAAKGSLKACTRCPEGRTTADDPAQQEYIGQCIVDVGFGLAASIVAGNLPENITQVAQGALPASTISAADMQQINTDQCPTGFYGGGGLLLSTCVRCPGYFTTEGPGKTSDADCNVCVAGRGVVNGACELCDYGTYQPGFLRDCITCPSATFYAPVDGNGPTFTSMGTTFEKGATNEESCVPMQSQLSPEAGQAYFAPSFDISALLSTFYNQSSVQSMDDCVWSCQEGKNCLAQYDEASQTCLKGQFSPAADTTTGAQLFYKLPPAALSSASSVKGANSSSAAPGAVNSLAVRKNSPRIPRIKPGTLKTFNISRIPQSSVSAKTVAGKRGQVRARMLSSGSYARSVLPTDEAQRWEGAGTPLGDDARTFVTNTSAWRAVASVFECYELCDNSNVCWGGIFKDNKCLFRGGVDAIKTRSFFVLAAPGTATVDQNPQEVSYYYTFSSQGAGPKSYNFTDPDGLSLLQAAVVEALKEVSPFTSATIQAFEQVLDQQQMPGVVDDPNVVEIGFSFNDVEGAGQTDLATLFEGNQTTLAVVARKVVEAITATGSTAISPDLLYGGLSIYSSNGKRTNLGDPIVADGCTLIQDYCGTNGNGTCSMSKCSCKSGHTAPRCA